MVVFVIDGVWYMKKILCSVAVFALCLESLEAVTLLEALRSAFMNNKGWAASKTDKKKAEHQAQQALVAFGPNVSSSISMSRARNDNRNKNTLGNEAVYRNQSSESTGTSISLSVNQNIFNGFSTVNSLKVAEFSDDAAFHKLKKEEQDLILNVVNAYTEIWFCRKRRDALEKMVENLRNTWVAQQSSMEAGMATPTDVAEAESKYQGAIYSMIDAETQLSTAEAEFKKLTGLQADKDMTLPDFRFELPPSYENLIKTATASNHTIRYYQLQEQAALKNLDATRGRLAPSVDASLSATRQLSKAKSDDIRQYGNTYNYSASLSVTVPIFTNNSNGNTYSQISIANQEALKAKFTAEDTVLSIEKECIVNWNKYKSAIAMIKASRSAVKSAELSSEGNMEESALGMKSNTDVWAKENNLLESRVNLAKSQKERIVAAVTILSLTGRLTIQAVMDCIRIGGRKTTVSNEKDDINQKQPQNQAQSKKVEA